MENENSLIKKSFLLMLIFIACNGFVFLVSVSYIGVTIHKINAIFILFTITSIIIAAPYVYWLYKKMPLKKQYEKAFFVESIVFSALTIGFWS